MKRSRVFSTRKISTRDVLDNKNANAFSVGSSVLPLTFGFLSLGSTNVPALPRKGCVSKKGRTSKSGRDTLHP